MPHRSRLFPCLRYRDPKAAVDFLVRAFGFEVRTLHETPEGVVGHAELKLGEGIVMIGTLGPEALSEGRTASGGASSVYVSVTYVDAHHDKAAAAGAIMTRALEDTAYGSREYSCRDIEGYEWHFGSYDPFAETEV